MVRHPRCVFLNYNWINQQVEIYSRNVQPQHTPYYQLTTEILGIDHRHLYTSSPLVRRFHDAPDTETEN